MNTIRVSLVILVSYFVLGITECNARNTVVSSPDGAVTVTVGVKDHTPFYMVSYQGKTIVTPSHLGFLLDSGELGANTKMGTVGHSSNDDIWTQPWGESETVRNQYHEMVVNFNEDNGRQMKVVFRVFNDGFGFRYILPEYHKGKEFQILDELTEISLAHDAKAWSISANHTEYFEGIYTSDLLSRKDTVCTPLTIEYEKDLYLAIHEAALEDYASINLTPMKREGDNHVVCLRTALTPWRNGVKVYAKGEMKSPWRTMIISRTPGGLLTSNLMLNLNEPSRIEDTSWIEPGRYIGIWWSIHKKHDTWEMGPNHGATTENVKRYMDFAARHGFSGVLAEGWNPGWGQGEQISYLKSYPDFDMEEVTSYGLSKGVRFIGHTETWGNANLLENQMEEAFSWFEKLGIRAVKTGYVGHFFDGKELAKSQYGIRHYRRVIECAAKHHIMIDNHEPAMPTGIQRTMPNLMTQEGVRGQEYNAWDRRGGNPPAHTVTLPFTRGLAGPTDFTPAIFNFSEIVKGTHPHSTLAKQLGEFIVIYSPLQMAADAIENYEGQPALSFIESCPTTWRKTMVLNGEIGEYITVARQERASYREGLQMKGGDRWFIGSITNEKAREMDIALDFLDEGVKYRAVIYEDGPDADYEKNPYVMNIRQLEVTSQDKLRLKLARSGGAAVRIERKK